MTTNLNTLLYTRFASPGARFLLMGLLLTALSFHHVCAQDGGVPFRYQGTIVGPDGQPIPPGQYTLEFFFVRPSRFQPVDTLLGGGFDIRSDLDRWPLIIENRTEVGFDGRFQAVLTLPGSPSTYQQYARFRVSIKGAEVDSPQLRLHCDAVMCTGFRGARLQIRYGSIDFIAPSGEPRVLLIVDPDVFRSAEFGGDDPAGVRIPGVDQRGQRRKKNH